MAPKVETLPLKKSDLFSRLARTRLIDFVRFTFEGYETRWFNRLIGSRLDALLAGDIRRLMIFCPPQHGKSELVSRRFPAFCFGRNPNLRIASCTYSADLATNFSRQIMRIIDDQRYRELFPATRLPKIGEGYACTADSFELPGFRGSYKAVGVGGPLTGNPVDIGVIDDPVKDAVEAQSSTDRRRKWDWYNEVFCTRLHNDSRVLLTMTRWHEDDLAGRILRAEPDRWAVVKLPYIREAEESTDDPRQPGEALWPEKHSPEKAEDARRNSERTYASLLQQRPAPQEGGIFKSGWWRRYAEMPQRFDKIILSWDCAFKDLQTSDYVVGMVLGKLGSMTYVLDVVRGKWDFPETVRQIRRQIARWPWATEKLIEEKANGAAVIQTLRHEVPGIIPIVPKESKEARASAVSYLVESGCVHLPTVAPWLKAFEYELSVFPNGTNDDMVDAFTQALNRLYSFSTGQALRIAI